ncbi:MAG TPA: ABC transporter ATP-binding protein [Capillimicrobium sp.]
MTHDIALDIQRVSRHFGDTVALDEVTLQVARGEFVTLLGPSGSGKTTLLRLIVGFDVPTSGTIMLGDRDISRLTPANRSAGMVFQNYALFPHMTVAENVAYGLMLRKWPGDRQRERVAEMLDLVQLSGYQERYPRQLSGGQQQRVALARALAYDPEIILMDEPLGALDRALRLEMEEVIRGIHRKLHATMVYVTHDQQEALALSDRIAIMRGGKLVDIGTPERLYEDPGTSFVAGFFANANLLDAEIVSPPRDGRVRVRCAGEEVECRASGESGGKVQLAVRRRAFRREPVGAGGMAVRGRVAETLLFGDERQIALDVAGAGRVVALMEARGSADLDAGMDVVLHVPDDGLVVVDDRTTPEPGAPDA